MDHQSQHALVVLRRILRATENRARALSRESGLTASQLLLLQTPDDLQELFRKRFDKLEDWEQMMLVAALERIATMLDAEEIDAAPVLDFGELDREA